MGFVKNLANLTYETLENIAPYMNNTELTQIDILEMIIKVRVHINMLHCLKKGKYKSKKAGGIRSDYHPNRFNIIV